MAETQSHIEFSILVRRAREYLGELSKSIKRGQEGEIGQVVADNLAIAQLYIDIGLAANDLDPTQQATLRLMVTEINQVITILETINFRRKHNS